MQEQQSCLVDAFTCILKFGAENKPNVLRALVERLTTLWRRSPGGSERQRSPGIDKVRRCFWPGTLRSLSLASSCACVCVCSSLNFEVSSSRTITSPSVLGKNICCLYFPNPASSVCSISQAVCSISCRGWWSFCCSRSGDEG